MKLIYILLLSGLFLIHGCASNAPKKDKITDDEAEKIGQAFAEGFAKLSQLEVTPIHETDIPQSLKDDFSKDKSNLSYTYVKKKVKDIKNELNVPLPGKSVVEFFNGGFELLNKKNDFGILCHVGKNYNESLVYRDVIKNAYGSYKELTNWGESIEVRLINGRPLFNINTITTFQDGEDRLANYTNYTFFKNPSTGLLFGCFSNTTNKQLLLSFSEKLLKKNIPIPEKNIKYHVWKLNDQAVGLMTTYLDFGSEKGKKNKGKATVSFTDTFLLIPIGVGSVSGSTYFERSYEDRKGVIKDYYSTSYSSLGNREFKLKKIDGKKDSYSFESFQDGKKVDSKKVKLRNLKGLRHQHDIFKKITKRNKKKTPKKFKKSFFSGSTFNGKQNFHRYYLDKYSSGEVSYKIEGVPFSNYKVLIDKRTGDVDWSFDFPMPAGKMHVEQIK